MKSPSRRLKPQILVQCGLIASAIPEICPFGETMDEARVAAEEAVRCYLESAIKNGESISADAEPSQERIAVTV